MSRWQYSAFCSMIVCFALVASIFAEEPKKKPVKAK